MVVTVANQKGGVAKTTTVFTVSNMLADCKKSVLMIDLDPQASLTVCAGIDRRKLMWYNNSGHGETNLL